MISNGINKPLEKLDLDFIKKKVKAVTFDLDGVIVPTGTFLRESVGEKKLESESEGGQKFLPPNPLPFCPPERLDFKIRSSGFRQKMFEL